MENKNIRLTRKAVRLYNACWEAAARGLLGSEILEGNKARIKNIVRVAEKASILSPRRLVNLLAEFGLLTIERKGQTLNQNVYILIESDVPPEDTIKRARGTSHQNGSAESKYQREIKNQWAAIAELKEIVRQNQGTILCVSEDLQAMHTEIKRMLAQMAAGAQKVKVEGQNENSKYVLMSEESLSFLLSLLEDWSSDSIAESFKNCFVRQHKTTPAST
jgi:uncharacterized protein YeaO (DUF488 family)